MDLLTEMLSNYKGTLLIVSHDRDFLDQTVNKILYFEGKGKASLFLGGYSDFLNYQTQDKEIKSKKIKPINTKKQNKNEKGGDAQTRKRVVRGGGGESDARFDSRIYYYDVI